MRDTIGDRLRVGIFFGVLVAFGGQVQAQQSVKGRVINFSGEPVMGNAIVLATPDSGFVKGMAFLEGDFTIDGLNVKDAWVKLTSIEFYDTLFHVVFGDQPVVDLGTIQVKEKVSVLEEVQVTATKEMFQARPDGVMQVNVANTVLATSSSVSEILSRSPGVITTDEGLSVLGKGAATIYLNGKRIPPERVGSIPTNQVKSVEIISNPPASFGADGQAVINIITINDMPEGYKGTVQQQGWWSEMAGPTASTMVSANFRKGKFDMFGNYDLRFGKDSELLYTTRVRQPEHDYLSSELTWDQHRNMRNYSNYTTGISYDLGGKAYTSLEYNGSYQGAQFLTRSTNNIVTDSEEGLYVSDVTRGLVNRNHSLTFNLNLQTDTLGSTFFIGGQVSRFASKLLDDIDERNEVNGSSSSKVLFSDQQSDILVASPQMDFNKILRSGVTLSVGGKLSYARTSSGLRFYRFDEGQFKADSVRSNDFDYTEKIPAAYVQIEKRANRLTYAFGVRSEWTRYTLFTSAQGHFSNQSSYLNIFPNVQFGYAASDQWKWRLAYTSRINRPSYQSLSPSLIYQDSFTSSEGNPNLIPEKTHSIEAGATYRNFDFKAGYSYKDDPLDGAALRGSDNKTYILKNLNFDRGYSVFATVTATFNARWLTSVNTGSVTYGKLSVRLYNFEFLGETPQVYFYSSNKINVNNWFTVHVLAWYLGGRYISTRYANSVSLLTFGIEKELLKKSLKCSFTANDIFHSNYPSGRYIVGETDVVYNRWFNTNYYRLTLSYQFGKLKSASYRSKGTGDVENSRAR